MTADDELERMVERLMAQHRYVSTHRLCRAALRVGLRALTGMSPDDVRTAMVCDDGGSVAAE